MCSPGSPRRRRASPTFCARPQRSTRLCCSQTESGRRADLTTSVTSIASGAISLLGITEDLAMATAVSVKLDEKTQERMRQLAEARSRAPHYLMREAINQYLDREEARESFKQEA